MTAARPQITPNEHARLVAKECLRHAAEGNYERALFMRAGEHLLRLLGENERHALTPDPEDGHANPAITLEFMVGDDIRAACVEATRLARELRCRTHFTFNGVHCMAHPRTDPQVLAERWRAEVAKPAGMARIAAA